MFEKIRTLFRQYPDRCCIAIVIAAAVLPFLPSIGFNTFLYDDVVYVEQIYMFSPSWHNLKQLLVSKSVGLASPLVMLSFVPDYLVWGKDLFYAGCRVQNILWHCVAMVLFYLILREIKLRFKDGDEINVAPQWAMFAAVCAALHPQRVESVVWLAERKDVLVAAIAMTVIYTFIKAAGQQRTSVAAPVLLFLCCWGVKPMLMPLPLILTIGQIAATGRFEWKNLLKRLWPLYLAIALYAALNFQSLSGFSAGAIAEAGAAENNRIPLASYNILLYFVKTVFPYSLNPLYPQIDPASVSVMFTVLLLALIALFAALAIFRHSRQEFCARVLLPCGLMFGAAVLPVCNLQVIGNVDFADRYSYIPSLFIWCAAAVTLSTVCRSFSKNQCRMTASLAVLYIFVLAAMTAAYLPAWRNSVSQIDAMLNTPKPHMQALKIAAMEAYKKKQYQDAFNYTILIQNQSKLKVDTYFVECCQALIQIKYGQTDAGVARINAILRRPDWYMISNNPKAFVEEIFLSSAAWHLARRKDPEYLRRAANLFEMFSQAIADKSKLESLNYRAISYMIRGDLVQAEKFFLEALKFAPGDENLLKNLHNLRQKKVSR